MLDDEIVIGIDVKNDSNKTNSNKKKNSKNKNKSKKNGNNLKQNKQIPNKKMENNLVQNKQIQNSENTIKGNLKKKKRKKGKLKRIAIFLVIVVFLILIFSSSLFNIKNIVVNGNQKLSDEKIISLSSLEMYTNIFRFNKSSIIKNIKENAYVKEAKIKRILPGTIQIDIEERIPNYMLQFADSYVYINNQGYMLEISNDKLELPILIGFTTDLSNIKAGNRINLDDLNKMGMVIKIYEAAKSNELGDLITKIDISNDKNYTLILENEGKKVYLGDCSNLNTRILYLKSLLNTCEGKSGEIFLNMDLNSQNAYFRPSSN